MTLALILLMGMLNRIRGGGLIIGTIIKEKWHIKPLFLVAPVVPLLALLGGHTVITAVSLGLAYLTWALPAWGRWFDLNTLPDNYGREEGKYADPLEGWIDHVADDDYMAMWLRHGITLGVVLILMTIIAQNPLYLVAWPMATAGIVYAYDLGVRQIGTRFNIAIAEFLTGIIWGVLVCVP